VVGSTPEARTIQTKNGEFRVGIGAQPSSGSSVVAIESVDPEDMVDVDQDGIADQVPFGLLSFKVLVASPGDEAVITVYFSNPVSPRGKWYKYDPVGKRWYDYSAFTTFSSDRMSMTLTLADGGAGDADGVANGIIIDPAGIVESSSGGGGGGAIGGVVDGVGDVVSSIGGAGGGGCFIGAVAAPGGIGVEWLLAAAAAVALGWAKRKGVKESRGRVTLD
jgi:hypothetical protein